MTRAHPATPAARIAPRLALGVAAATLAAAGCSTDTHTYKSTQLAPKTVDLVYIGTGETAWTYEIPAGQMLTLDFDRKGEINGFRAPDTPPTSVEWFTVPLNTKVGIDGTPKKSKALQSDTVDLTGAPVKIVLSLRDEANADGIPTATGVPGLNVPPPQDLPEPTVDDADAGEAGLTVEEQISVPDPSFEVQDVTPERQTQPVPEPELDNPNAANSGAGDDSELLEVIESGLGSKPNPATDPTK